MSHFVKVENGIVTELIVAEQDFIDSGAVGNPVDWIQTSYNTIGNVHYDPITRQPDGGIALRGNYAGIGNVYDAENDVFYRQQPYPSWTLNKTTWLWEPPVPYPSSDQIYDWDEETKNWVLNS